MRHLCPTMPATPPTRCDRSASPTNTALPCPEVTLDGGVDSDTSRTFHKPFALRKHPVIGLWNDIP